MEADESDLDRDRSSIHDHDSHGPEQSIFISQKKRKANDREATVDRRDHRPKRLKTAYSDDYRKEFNSVAAACNDLSTEESHSTTQHGMSVWSGEEKARLFAALERHGRTDLSAVIRQQSTKSEMEVMQYLQTLQQGVAELEHKGRTQTLVRIADIPAAAEVSPECCDALELAADSLALLCKDQDENAEYASYGEGWLLSLDRDQTNSIGRETLNDRSCLITPNDDADLCLSKSMAMLDWEKMLELSTGIFMNGSQHDLDWRHQQRPTGPGLFASALVSFHRLVTNVTQQLIGTSLLQAQARLRAASERGAPAKALVNVGDVATACKTLGFQQDSFDFWRRCPRRLQLLPVIQKKDLKQKKFRAFSQFLGDRKEATVSFDDAEAFLTDHAGLTGQTLSSETPVMSIENDNHESQPMILDEGSNEGTSDEDSPVDSTTSDGSSSAKIPSRRARIPSTTDVPSRTEKEMTRKEDAYLRYIDAKASRKEEIRLWSMLVSSNTAAQEHLNLDDEQFNEVNKPPTERKSTQELTDWRTYTSANWRASWERYPRSIAEDSFYGYRDVTLRRDLSHSSRSTSRSESVESSSSRSNETRRSRSRGRAPSRRADYVDPALNGKDDTECESSARSPSRGRSRTIVTSRRGRVSSKGSVAVKKAEENAAKVDLSESEESDSDSIATGGSRSPRPARQSRSATPAYTFGYEDEDGPFMRAPLDDSEDEFLPK